MTTRSAAVAASALAAAGVAVGVWASTGKVPDAPAGSECVVVLAQGPCSAALALGSPDECEAGTLVTRYVEIPLPAVDAPGSGLPPGFDGIPGTAVTVDCGSLDDAGKALHVPAMSKHGKARRTKAKDGQPARDVVCAEVVVDGHPDPACVDAVPVAAEVGP